MQTFLPYPDFDKSARVLDNKRLGKQRVECLQILRTLLGYSDGWKHHPAVKMWRGHEGTLALYGMDVCLEWQRRGYQDSCFEKIDRLFPNGFAAPSPPWMGREDFHASHRSNLLRKDPVWYGQWGWTEPRDLPYFWPVRS